MGRGQDRRECVWCVCDEVFMCVYMYVHACMRVMTHASLHARDDVCDLCVGGYVCVRMCDDGACVHDVCIYVCVCAFGG